MAKTAKSLVAQKKMTELLTVDLKDLDSFRALQAMRSLEGQYAIDYFVLRDAVEKEHEPFVYFSNGFTVYSHERKGNTVTFYVEEYELVPNSF